MFLKFDDKIGKTFAKFCYIVSTSLLDKIAFYEINSYSRLHLKM
jgi:hypothetical protein